MSEEGTGVSGATAMEQPLAAVVWDFDWSLVNENSDTWIFQQLGSPATNEIMKRKHIQWTRRCDQAITHLQVQDGVSIDQIKSTFAQLPVFPEVITMIRSLRENGADQFIVSDANTFFIDAFVGAHEGLADCFSKIVSNRAWVQDAADADIQPPPASSGDADSSDSTDAGLSGTAATVAPEVLLRIAAYHEHECRTGVCPPNLCKGLVISQELFGESGQLPSGRVIYVGDGTGDLCAAMRLRETDVLLVRRDFRLDKFLQRQAAAAQQAAAAAAHAESDSSTSAKTTEQHTPTTLRCRVVRWGNGVELFQAIEKLMKRSDSSLGRAC